MGLRKLMVGFVCAAVLAGCGGFEEEEDADEVTAEAEGALIDGNALNLNALNLNALNLNALNLNALNLNSLSTSSLTAIRDAGPSGDLARAFLRYAVGCALTSNQSFNFTWTDAGGAAHNESYRGELGVAPAWATGPLSSDGQRMVSACVAARVNYYQVPVVISMRSLTEPLKTLTGTKELADYPDVEGAFWGNLFGSQPVIHACYNSATVSNSRAHKRDCAAGHLTVDPQTGAQTITECGIIDIAGPCSQVCQTLNGAGQYYPSCLESPGQTTTTTKLVVTTALP